MQEDDKLNTSSLLALVIGYVVYLKQGILLMTLQSDGK